MIQVLLLLASLCVSSLTTNGQGMDICKVTILTILTNNWKTEMKFKPLTLFASNVGSELNIQDKSLPDINSNSLCQNQTKSKFICKGKTQPNSNTRVKTGTRALSLGIKCLLQKNHVRDIIWQLVNVKCFFKFVI